MPLTERELQAIREIEARLELSSPDLARRLTAPRFSPRLSPRFPARPVHPRAGLTADRGRVAALLAALAVALVVATVVTASGVAVGITVVVVLSEMFCLLTVAHFAGRSLHRPPRR